MQFIDRVVLFMDKLLTARRCARHACCVLENTRGNSTGAVLGQGVHACCCPSLWLSRCVENCVVSQLPVAHQSSDCCMAGLASCGQTHVC